MRRDVVLFIVFIIAVFFILAVLVYFSDPDYLSKTNHETHRWAVIEDSKRDIIAVETTDTEVWNILKALSLNQTEMWIGGFVVEYNNYWDFRFRTDSIIVAEITIEGAQSNIQGISGDLDYWINVWGKQAYVLATVSELHE